MNAQFMAPMQVSESFERASGHENTCTKAKSASPFSIRLTVEERAYLDQQAGSRPLGAYIREKLLGEHAQKRRILRKPQMEDIQYSTLLAALGQSRMASNLNQLAKHANMGTLDISRDLDQELQDACGAVLAMRDALFMALGQRPMANKDKSR